MMSLIVTAILTLSWQPDPDANASLRAALDCRGISEDAARLRCYDQAMGRLQQAAGEGRLVLAEPARVETPLPREINGAVAQARLSGYNRWVVELEDGSVWRTIEDSSRVPLPRPRQRVRLTRSALGHYLLQAGPGRSLKAVAVRD
jgi:hypothetical protein